MLGYATLGTNNIDKAKSFYDAVLAPLGGQRAFDTERMQGYASAGGGAMLAICRPYDEQPARAGNGAMVALAAPSRAVVVTIRSTMMARSVSGAGPPAAMMRSMPAS